MSSSSSIWSIVGLGLGFGVVHVLTGPDHLSALATLAANVGNTSRAFVTGVQWGIGHSIGLVMVATGLLLALPPLEDDGGDNNEDEEIDVSERLSTLLESCVGVFMILLGLYGIYEAIRRNKQQSNSTSGDETKLMDLEMTTPSIAIHDHPGHYHHHHNFVQMTDDGTNHPDETDAEKALGAFRAFVRTLVTIGIGIVHGVAGPGGVLGVLPAVQLREWKLAGVYLGCFCLTSTLTMGIFAALWGTCSSKIATKVSALVVELASAGLSITVGILWLLLLSLGILEDVFP